ncbi:hypothetical protein [Methylobacterium sp. J-068]|uniref:hypothetical protein n=1 Tax=Methylobacterium sp. J-068 TaxID=2836649 RepID=UPI001FBBC0E8|nr:hypothetical protein [Methylobacterium sp. J-068]MCJ2034877.1 hypothetical protein [Methylobacterium sp. J-068]
MSRLTASLFTLATIMGGSAVIALAVLAGVRAVPAGEGHPAPREPGRDVWSLRPSDVTMTSAIGPAETRPPAAAMPEERRMVRVVYPGLIGPR